MKWRAWSAVSSHTRRQSILLEPYSEVTYYKAEVRIMKSASDLIVESVQTGDMAVVCDHELNDVDAVWEELEMRTERALGEEFNDDNELQSITFQGHDLNGEGWCVQLRF
jgi:hypothetical protein